MRRVNQVPVWLGLMSKGRLFSLVGLGYEY